MTKAQEKTLNAIKREIHRFDFYNRPDEYEIKEWKEWEPDCKGQFMVTFETDYFNENPSRLLTLFEVFVHKMYDKL